MFRYTVTEQDYLKMAKWLLVKQRGPKSTAVPKLLLKTVVQMGAVAWLLLTFPEELGSLKWILIVVSLLYASFVLFRYFFLDVRANMLLIQAKREAGAQDLWKEHELKLKGDSLQLSYGSVRSEIPCREVTEVEEWEDLSLILKGREVFEAIPKRVKTSEDWPGFRAQILEIADREQIRAQEELKKSLSDKPDFLAPLYLSQEEMADKIVKMQRRALLYVSNWNFSSFFAFLFPLGLAAYAAYSKSWSTFAFCAVFFLILNGKVFRPFMPNARQNVRQQLLPPGEDGYLLALKDKTAYLLTERNSFTYPMQSLRLTARQAGDLFLYFKQQRMLFVPARLADAFLRAARGEKSMRE